jgi:hypothetical protein
MAFGKRLAEFEPTTTLTIVEPEWPLRENAYAS